MKHVRPYGPWIMTYKPGMRTCGLMLSADDNHVAVSGAFSGRGVAAGWRAKRWVFKARKHVLGRER